ncbi:endoglucanase [Methylobacterium indicum]|uniref:Glucanase n=1 Tax=Methylobacterium indicum TaxID=1775910 RepID=A0A8H8WZ82_9HYPH|nr:endoglucanase [Methylobacterium indicum]
MRTERWTFARRRSRRRFRTVVLALALAGAPGPSAAGASGAPPAPIAGRGLSIDPAAWSSFKDRFVTREGRVVDTANGRISHSEGQGYGLLFAAAAGDRPTFERIWDWTRLALRVRKDALFAWRWEPDVPVPVGDPNNATDGDILIAWALVEAAERWPDGPFRHAARRIAEEIGGRLVLWEAAGGPLIMPGLAGFGAGERSDGPVVNLSYWVFPAFARLATVAPAFPWGRLEASGLDLVRRARFGASRVPTDWIAMAGNRPRPAAGFPATLSYNAVRVPLYLAMAGQDDRALYEAFATAWSDGDPVGLPIVDPFAGRTGERGGERMGEPGYAAIRALTACIASGARVPASFATPSPSENYYPAVLHILALSAARRTWPACLDR